MLEPAQLVDFRTAVFPAPAVISLWESVDARIGTPTEVPWPLLRRLADRLIEEVPGVVSVTYNLATKPPSTMEAI